MNQMDLDWSSDGYHKLNVTFAYTYWTNNSLQAYGMQLVDAGLGFFADTIGGLGGNAIGALGQAGNALPNALGGAAPFRDPDQPFSASGARSFNEITDEFDR
jgi:hypothetical protein